MDAGVAQLDLAQVATLNFEKPDFQRFPCLALAIQALDAGGVASTVLNAANELAVEAFLERRIGFMDIASTVDAVLNHLTNREPDGLDDVLAADAEARREAAAVIAKLPVPRAERVA